MRAALSLVGLLVVLLIIAVNVRHQLQATRAAMPAPAASTASAPFGGSSSPSVAQFQQELDKTMRQADERAAHAADEADKSN
ncbi:MAG TPA: hypothetical protein VF457_16510 [Burkholderiaceae bacterium]